MYSIYVLSHQNSWQILIIWKISIVKTQYVGTKIIWCPIWYTKLSFAPGEWELTFDSEMVQIHRITLIPLSATKICLQSGGLKWNIKQSYKCQESLWKKPLPVYHTAWLTLLRSCCKWKLQAVLWSTTSAELWGPFSFELCVCCIS